MSPTRILAVLLSVLAIFTAGAAAQENEERRYILATATTGGTYYPVGVAIATLTKVKLEPTENLSLSAISSAGSGENVKLLRDGEAQFAILQGLYGAYAWAGEGPLEGQGQQEHLRAVSMLWPNVEHFTLRKRFVDTGTIEDLKAVGGRKFSIGKRASGTEGSGRYILGQLGIDPDTTFSLVYQGYGASAEALQNGLIDGMNTPAGAPVSAVTQAFAAMGKDLRVLDFTDEQLARVNAKYALWSRFDIPAGTYPGQDTPISTIAQPNFLAVHKDVPEEDVYLVVKAMYENLGFLGNIHAATKAMSLEKGTAGLPMPLHPGARRYFEEQGILDPQPAD